MKKAIALLLAVMLVVSMAPAAFASTTTLTTNVPDATYTFEIPANTPIDYNALDTSIGYVHVTESAGFAVGKNLQITIEYGPFVNTANSESTIPYRLYADNTDILTDNKRVTDHDGGSWSRLLKSGDSIIIKGTNEGTVRRWADNANTSAGNYIGDLGVLINSSDWGKALGGDYTSTITFTAKVVQE